MALIATNPRSVRIQIEEFKVCQHFQGILHLRVLRSFYKVAVDVIDWKLSLYVCLHLLFWLCGIMTLLACWQPEVETKK